MRKLHLACWLFLWLCLPAFGESAPAALTLGDALRLAVTADPWLLGSQYREEALLSEATAAGSMPDPTLSIAAGNLPLDTFDINQEAMTQFTVGVSQAFPRGDSRALSRQQRMQLAEQEPLLREERSAQVQRTVTQLWFTAYLAQETIGLVEQSRGLFDHLLAAASTRYSAALGGTRQQDLVRAQLELTLLEDRLTGLQQRRDAAQRQLAEWIGADAALPLAAPPPDSSPVSETVLRASPRQHREWIVGHPAVRAVDRRIDAVTTEVELARQGYRPAWGVSAQYGYRDDDPMGRDRADLLSVGVTFDLPLFTDERQDKQVSATLARVAALRTERQLLARRLLAELETALARLQRIDERADLYATRLLPQMADQAEAALAAYNNDDGDFAEAVRGRIAQLDAHMASLAIAIERQQLMASIKYLTVAAEHEIREAPAQMTGTAQ